MFLENRDKKLPDAPKTGCDRKCYCKANDEVNNSPYVLNTEGYNWIQCWTHGVVFRGD